MDDLQVPPDFHPSDAWRHALSWWWAAELMHRHPKLSLVEEVTNYGHQDCLAIYKWIEGRPQRRVLINRNGNIHMPGRTTDSIDQPWAAHLSADDAHDLIRHIESASGLGHPAATPRSENNSLAVRVIAAALMATVQDRRPLACHMIGSAGDVAVPLREEELEPLFPHGHRPATDGSDADVGKRWLISRDGQPLALVDLSGFVQLRERAETAPIMSAYVTRHRKLLPTVTDLLSDIL